MSSNTAVFSIGMLVASFLGGMLLFLVIDNRKKQDKKYQLDQFLNMLIQFILYLWAAKVMLQLPRFVHDPISVLAYPSNSLHFFFASMILACHLFIKYRKNKLATVGLFQTSNFILLSALFFYEFFQIIVKPGVHFDVMTIVLTVLLLVYVLFYAKINQLLLSSLLVGMFFFMASSIGFYKGYFMLFGFMISPYYFLLLIILLCLYSYSMYKSK